MAEPNARLSPETRYLRDPEFHALVHLLLQALERCDYTPTELREAVILAATIHEQHRVRSAFEEPTDG